MAGEMRNEVDVERWIGLGGVGGAAELSYETGLEGASIDEPERPPLDTESTYCILYTSGTTGKPKGAVLPAPARSCGTASTLWSVRVSPKTTCRRC